jgi:hypothetical protein
LLKLALGENLEESVHESLPGISGGLPRYGFFAVHPDQITLIV